MTSQKSHKNLVERVYCPTCKLDRNFEKHSSYYSCEGCNQKVIPDYIKNPTVQEFYRKWRKEEEGR